MGLFDIFTDKNAKAAASDQTQGLTSGYNDASTQVGQGSTDLINQYTAAMVPFLQNYTQAGQGTTALGNALGLNGAAGSSAATKAFQANPGYQFALDQGTQNVDRNQAAKGMLASGNTDKAVADYTTGLANQGWQQYIQNLQPYLGQANTAASGMAGVDTGLGQSLNTNQNTIGNLAWMKDTGIGNANANADLAKNTASGNIWGAIQTGIGDATKLAGMFGA